MIGKPGSPEQREVVQHPDIARKLIEMAEVDQKMRMGELESGEWDDSIDAANTVAMKAVIESIGWPGVSKVDKEASHMAWLLVQHADHDPQFQEECLQLMREQSPGEVAIRDMAYLEDRIRVNTKRPQVYGTQFHETRDDQGAIIAYGPRPIESPEGVDQRRASVGLEPMEDYTKEITARYYPHLVDKNSE